MSGNIIDQAKGYIADKIDDVKDVLGWNEFPQSKVTHDKDYLNDIAKGNWDHLNHVKPTESAKPVVGFPADMPWHEDVSIKKVDRCPFLDEVKKGAQLEHADTCDKSQPLIEGEGWKLKSSEYREKVLEDVRNFDGTNRLSHIDSGDNVKRTPSCTCGAKCTCNPSCSCGNADAPKEARVGDWMNQGNQMTEGNVKRTPSCTCGGSCTCKPSCSCGNTDAPKEARVGDFLNQRTGQGIEGNVKRTPSCTCGSSCTCKPSCSCGNTDAPKEARVGDFLNQRAGQGTEGNTKRTPSCACGGSCTCKPSCSCGNASAPKEARVGDFMDKKAGQKQTEREGNMERTVPIQAGGS